MPLNILFINSIMIYGGGEVWMITAALELIRRGHNLTIVCKQGSLLEEYAAKNNIKVITLKIRGDIDPSTIFDLYKIVLKNKIDIVLTNMDKELRLAGIVSRLSGKSKIVARHGIDYPLKDKLHYRITYNHLTDIIIANSEATKKTLFKNASWLNPERIKVIYNGIDIEKYLLNNTRDLREELGIAKERPLIGFVGRLSIQKGIKYLLESFLQIRNIIDANLLIAGTGELEQEIKDFVDKNNLKSSIHLLGFREDVNNIMRTIDLLVLPSLWEGFGIVLIEAMAAGKPCVTTQISSMPEIVKDNVSGLIVPTKDSTALANAYEKILSNKDYSMRLGNEGKKIVMERFTIGKMIDNYEKVFYKVLK